MRRTFVICLLLSAVLFGAYSRLGAADFVSFDDPGYVTQNPQVNKGLTSEGIRWAFGFGHKWNWHPVTWMSHMLDVEIFGLSPAGHHLVNLLLHVLTTLLLFGVLHQMTGERGASAFTAALFGLHPLRVESVAWISERKDVLSGALWMLTLLAYCRYARRGGTGRYWLTALVFAVGLAAKEMLVTLPFVLLLLDYWPLARMRGAPGAVGPLSFRRLVLEKVPLLALTAASCIVTLYVQGHGGSITRGGHFSLSMRIGNAALSYVRYLGKLFWPTDLAAFYPHAAVLQSRVSILGSLLAALLLVLASALAVVLRRRYPFVPVGWFWYLGTLVPVVGLVQVGLQSMADRYTYIPSIGLSILLAWGGAELVRGHRLRRRVLATAAAAALGVCALLTWRQVGTWKNSETLANQMLEATEDNWKAHLILGQHCAREGRSSEATEHFSRALEIHPGNAEAYNELGNMLADQGRNTEAAEQFESALSIRPDYVEAHINLAALLGGAGHYADAIAHLERALELRPGLPETHYNLASALGYAGREAEAIAHWKELVRLQPENPQAHLNLGIALSNQGDHDAANRHLREFLRLNPSGDEAEVVRQFLGNLPEDP